MEESASRSETYQRLREWANGLSLTELIERLEAPHKRKDATRYHAALQHIALRKEAASRLREMQNHIVKMYPPPA